MFSNLIEASQKKNNFNICESVGKDRVGIIDCLAMHVGNWSLRSLVIMLHSSSDHFAIKNVEPFPKRSDLYL